MANTEQMREAVARAIWNIRREDEDRCDLELEDMGKSHSVWREADAALAALAQPVERPDAVEFPDRDLSKPAEQQGIFRKFDVRRVDGSDAPGGKHHGCRYFVLDMDHDAHAPSALLAYADSCAESHPQLAADLRAEFANQPQQRGKAQEPVATVRVRHKGYSVELSTYVAYALPEGLHDLYAAAPQVAQEEGAREPFLTKKQIEDVQFAWDRLHAHGEHLACQCLMPILSKIEAAPQSDAQQSIKKGE